MRKIKKHKLDYKKTFPYFIDHIKCGNTLSRKIIERVDLSQGSFFTLLPADSKLERLYEFLYGGIIPTTPYGDKVYMIKNYPNGFYPQQVITMDKTLSEFITNYIRNNRKHCVIVENVLLEPSDTHVDIKNAKMIPYGKEVYF